MLQRQKKRLFGSHSRASLRSEAADKTCVYQWDSFCSLHAGHIFSASVLSNDGITLQSPIGPSSRPWISSHRSSRGQTRTQRSDLGLHLTWNLMVSSWPWHPGSSVTGTVSGQAEGGKTLALPPAMVWRHHGAVLKQQQKNGLSVWTQITDKTRHTWKHWRREKKTLIHSFCSERREKLQLVVCS